MTQELDMVEVAKSFQRTDRIVAFKKELTQLIVEHQIHLLLDVPSHILALFAVGQMEICSSVAKDAKGERAVPVLIM